MYKTVANKWPLLSLQSHVKEVSHSSTLVYLECKTSVNKWQTSGHFWSTWVYMYCQFRSDKSLNRGRKQSLEVVVCYRKDNPGGLQFLRSPIVAHWFYSRFEYLILQGRSLSACFYLEQSTNI